MGSIDSFSFNMTILKKSQLIQSAYLTHILAVVLLDCQTANKETIKKIMSRVPHHAGCSVSWVIASLNREQQWGCQTMQ